MRRTVRRKFLSLLLFVLILSACVPAQLPPQLAYTPGAAAVVDTGLVEMPSSYRIPRLDGWDVQLSAANAPESVILIAPDKQAIIIVSPDPNYPLPETASIPAENRFIVDEVIELSSQPLYLWLMTTSEQSESRTAEFIQLVEAVTTQNN
jgi:hypothetical protein